MGDDRGSNLDALNYTMPRRRKLEVGEVIEGRVVLIGSSHVFVDVGGKSEASMDLVEVKDDDGNITVKVGDKIHAYIVAVEPEVRLSRALAQSQLNIEALENARELGLPVEGKVTGINKGGLEVSFAGARAFCPISQIALGFVEDASVFVGQTLQFRVTQFENDGRNIVVSRRAILEEEREQQMEETYAQLQEGAEFDGEVISLHAYGAFIDIGGVHGLLHISQISHQRVEHPSELLTVGQKVRVQVVKVERDPKDPKRLRVGLSMRSLLGDPWDHALSALEEGATLQGTVMRLEAFGAFVQIAPGVEGLVHVSEISDRRISHPKDVLTKGQVIQVNVLSIDRAARRISLSMRASAGSSAGIDSLNEGDVVTAIVDKVKPFGLLVRLPEYGREGRGLIPVEEAGSGGSGGLRKEFVEGKELQAVVLSIDRATGRIRLSVAAAGAAEERKDYEKFMTSAAPPSKGKGQADNDKQVGTLGAALMRALKKDQ